MEVSYYGNFLYDILIDMYVKKKDFVGILDAEDIR